MGPFGGIHNILSFIILWPKFSMQQRNRFLGKPSIVLFFLPSSCWKANTLFSCETPHGFQTLGWLQFLTTYQCKRWTLQLQYGIATKVNNWHVLPNICCSDLNFSIQENMEVLAKYTSNTSARKLSQVKMNPTGSPFRKGLLKIREEFFSDVISWLEMV